MRVGESCPSPTRGFESPPSRSTFLVGRNAARRSAKPFVGPGTLQPVRLEDLSRGRRPIVRRQTSMTPGSLGVVVHPPQERDETTSLANDLGQELQLVTTP